MRDAFNIADEDMECALGPSEVIEALEALNAEKVSSWKKEGNIYIHATSLIREYSSGGTEIDLPNFLKMCAAVNLFDAK